MSDANAKTAPDAETYPPITGKEDLLNLMDYEVRTVQVPEWKRSITVKTLSASQREAHDATVYITDTADDGSVTIRHNFKNLMARLCVQAIVDPNTGERLFKDEDAFELGKRSYAGLKRVYDAIQDMSGMKVTAKKEAEKNS